MEKTPPMTLPLRRTPKQPEDHVVINPAINAWRKERKARGDDTEHR
jgi:hypothetical protein